MVMNEKEYIQLLKIDAVTDFLTIIIKMIKENSSSATLIKMEVQRLLKNLDDIERADFGNAEQEKQPPF